MVGIMLYFVEGTGFGVEPLLVVVRSVIAC